MASPEILRVDGERDDASARIVVKGELDTSSAPTLSAAIREACAAQPTEVVVDVTALTFCDSSGLRAFVQASTACGEHGISLRIVSAQHAVRRVFEIASLAQLLDDDPN